VAGWYLKAAHYLSDRQHGQAHQGKRQFQDVRFGPQGSLPDTSPEIFIGDLFAEADRADETARQNIRCAFVSTNSITQGEQVGVLWGELLRQGMRIHFAHRTFKWSNDAPGKAAVHCVIVGFARGEPPQARLFDYADPAGEAHELKVARINPYLVDAPTTTLPNREQAIGPVPKIGIGNKPIDGGHYLFTPAEKTAFLAQEPKAEKWFRRWIGADEFINGFERCCLWLGDCPPDELRRMPEALKRVQAVKAVRLASKSPPTQKLADRPTRFHVENMPDAPFLVIPEVSSERRAFIPIGFMGPDTLCSSLVKIVPNATLYHFAILTSTMHMAWVRAVCGRLKSDYRYSAGIVYNNFPWPSPPGEARCLALESAAQAVLDARSAHPGSTLADLYDANAMPDDLRRAHKMLDKAVDAAYQADGGQKTWASDAERVAFLFQRYAALTCLL
jgi:hypothetical protein